jgi:hypothetical protein
MVRNRTKVQVEFIYEYNFSKCTVDQKPYPECKAILGLFGKALKATLFVSF